MGYRNAWGEWVVAQLGDRVLLEGVTVEVHGGVDFAQPLRHPLARRGAALDLQLPGTWQERPSARPDEPHEPESPEGPRAPLGRLLGLVSRHLPGASQVG